MTMKKRGVVITGERGREGRTHEKRERARGGMDMITIYNGIYGYVSLLMLMRFY